LVFRNNGDGRLGLGDNKPRNMSTQIPNLKASRVSAGYYNTVIIDLNNNVWIFGCNYYGQLGLDDTIERNVPTQIPNIKAKYTSV
jgi:alpha-tubulin suppressor-like RCC1 family protein